MAGTAVVAELSFRIDGSDEVRKRRAVFENDRGLGRSASVDYHVHPIAGEGRALLAARNALLVGARLVEEEKMGLHILAEGIEPGDGLFLRMLFLEEFDLRAQDRSHHIPAQLADVAVDARAGTLEVLENGLHLVEHRVVAFAQGAPLGFGEVPRADLGLKLVEAGRLAVPYRQEVRRLIGAVARLNDPETGARDFRLEIGQSLVFVPLEFRDERVAALLEGVAFRVDRDYAFCVFN